ncbi:hypothetical protein K490DRAFT_35804 [Saccharata proteae CBS 121410]|uniref:Bifunctional lycopene cyclase/phytoene synthase n=1 Tax=Saccharata proteae CBS 121410 TaxID=1314787 RepID=A0A9P4LXB6_9PEZI|nr:hypothetical protein K490DRAFT_35804 [Saccharata proteae CBS 121410]
MGYEYALVHLKYTIPPAVALTFLYRPLLTTLDVYKICFLVAIAVVSTTPWDSYLIRTRIWTYPENVIVGPKLFDIPAEEVFFFFIQTYTTSLLYLLLSKPVFHSVYLRAKKHGSWKKYQLAGQALLLLGIGQSIRMIRAADNGTYLGLIVLWAFPFLLLLWSLAYQLIIGLPKSSTLIPIFLPTLYLWIVDTLALRRGTWVIEHGTKLGLTLWPGLEIEEAFFFLATNTLIVFGLIAFDNALAVLNTFPDLFPKVPSLPSPALLVKALILSTSKYDVERIDGLKQAVHRLRMKSRSFYLASGTFQGRLRIDLIILYSFCRVADDLVDDASSLSEARQWIQKLKTFLDYSYKVTTDQPVSKYVRQSFPPDAQLALLQLPTQHLTRTPLYSMLEGFEMDLSFSLNTPSSTPIKTVADLDLYGARVAGTVAQSILELVFHHLPSPTTTPATKQNLITSGARMGIALQYVNISRDIAVDARIGRVYMPLSWLREHKLSPAAVIASPQDLRVETLRLALLDRAFAIYDEARGAIEALPLDARGSMRVAVESYMEIGRVIRERGEEGLTAGRATVPKIRRVRVAWRALRGSDSGHGHGHGHGHGQSHALRGSVVGGSSGEDENEEKSPR